MVAITGVAAAAAIFTLWVGISTLRASKRNYEQQERDSREANRPMMVAELQLRPYLQRRGFLVISNLGRTVARNVQVTLDPPIDRAHVLNEHYRSTINAIQTRYADPIPVFIPGQTWTNLYWIGTFYGDHEKEVDVADRFTVRISYDDGSGHDYGDEFVLDWKTLGMETLSSTSEDDHGLLKSIRDHLKHVDDSLVALKGASRFVARYYARRTGTTDELDE